jgi:hypothetical protein
LREREPHWGGACSYASGNKANGQQMEACVRLHRRTKSPDNVPGLHFRLRRQRLTHQLHFYRYVNMASLEVSPGRGSGTTPERARTKCDCCRQKKCKVRHASAPTTSGKIQESSELILGGQCRPSDRDWSNGVKCIPCEKGGLPCGPNVPFSASSLPHGSGRGPRPAPIQTSTASSAARPPSTPASSQRPPAHRRPSSAHNRGFDVSPVSAGSSAGPTTASFAEASLESPTPTSANGTSHNSPLLAERCDVLIYR